MELALAAARAENQALRGDSVINQAVIQRNPDPYVFYE